MLKKDLRKLWGVIINRSYKAAASESKRSSSFLLDDVVTSPALPYQSNCAGNIVWYSYAWDSFGKSQEERNFIVKLDLSLLVFSVLGLLMRYIDQKNVDSAYVSGMREELNLYVRSAGRLRLNFAQ
ncbi:hypothetical protein F5146DRAFT_1056628 [Armillaria mellea]|nr:hypothetical protein F5146DRAFT_1056628 [Armillaria mellea]